MRSFFTALAFLIILSAVIPAVKRSINPTTGAAPSKPEDEHDR
ncbi:MAG: hypothetical protein O7G88_09720 [bacterium]|nr:hypothetical protein [bacterium]